MVGSYFTLIGLGLWLVQFWCWCVDFGVGEVVWPLERPLWPASGPPSPRRDQKGTGQLNHVLPAIILTFHTKSTIFNKGRRG